MRTILALCAALLCSGCALTTTSIDVPYQSITNRTSVQGASSVTVQVVSTDGRTTNRDRVGCKKNGYGMEMAPIIASNSIPGAVQDAFTQELTERGFKLGPKGVTLNVQVEDFYNDFHPGFFAADAVSTVAFNVEIVTPGNHIAFTRYYSGTGDDPNIQIMGGDNARDSLIKAFQSAVASAIADPAFLSALVAAGATAPGA